MSTEPFTRDQFKKIADDHDILAAYGRHVKQWLMAESPRYLEKQVAQIEILLSQLLVNHFSLEEKHIFPAVLAANLGGNTAQIVRSLQEDHLSLLAEAGQVRGMLLDKKIIHTRSGQLQTVLISFFKNLQKHHALETELFRTLPFSKI